MRRSVLLAVLVLSLGQRAVAQEDDQGSSEAPHRVIVRHPGAEAPEPGEGGDAPTPPPAPAAPPAEPSRAESAPPVVRPVPSRKKGKSKTSHRAKAKAQPTESVPAESPRAVRPSELPSDEEAPAAPTRAAAGGSFSFDLMPEEQKSTPEDQLRLEREVDTRRSMLQWHQGLGIATAVLMAGTVVLGQLSYSDRFGGGGSTGQFEIWHSSVEAATVLSFAAAGIVALAAPVPYEKKSTGVDTVTVHKYSMLVATIGMATEVPLGIYTVAREGYADQATLAVIHLVIGYVTAAALGTGVGALFF